MKSFIIFSTILFLQLNSFATQSPILTAETNSLRNLNTRIAPTLEVLFSVASNEPKTSENEITQKEGQAVLRIIHRDQLSSMDVLILKKNISEDSRYKSLSDEKKIDLDNFISDVSFVRSRMAELESFEKLHCRFALRNDPMDEVPEDSVSKKPEHYKILSSEQISEIKLRANQRAVVGLCWSQADRDPFIEWTNKSREFQYMTLSEMTAPNKKVKSTDSNR
jgi:hypothetical protein